MIKVKLISLCLVAVMFFCFLTGCDNNINSNVTGTSSGLPADLEGSNKNNIIKLTHLKNHNTTLGDIDMFDDIEEQLYSSFCVLNTYNEFIDLKNNFNSSKPVFEKLVNLLNNINYDETYFENKSIIISPFLHSSDEKNISFLDIQIDDTAKETALTFQFESPESVDLDIIVDYFVIEVDRQDFVDRDNYSKTIHGYNVWLNSSGSSCYRYKEEK